MPQITARVISDEHIVNVAIDKHLGMRQSGQKSPETMTMQPQRNLLENMEFRTALRGKRKCTTTQANSSENSLDFL